MTEWCAECSGWGEWIGYKPEIKMMGYVCCHVCKGQGLMTTPEKYGARMDDFKKAAI